MKFGELIVAVTGITLLIQVVVLYRSSCYVLRSSREGRTSLTSDRQLLDTIDNNSQLAGTSREDKGDNFEPTLVPFKDPYRRRHLTIGIPTVRRKDGTYIFKMLDSMFNKTSQKDLREIIFIVFLADFDMEWKKNVSEKMTQRYHSVIDQGALHVIHAPVSFYDDMKITKLTYGASEERVKWRTKQNFDYAYLLKYSRNVSTFYMQMEDDVVASDNYYGDIKDFIKSQADHSWICLEFSELGFIGKLYHSRDVEKLADMLLLFNLEQPVDYTYLYFNTIMLQSARIIRKPTLFQHIGYHSSLPQKIQSLKDRYFDMSAKVYKGDNPAANLYTTMKVHPDFPPGLAYSLEPGHFWSAAEAKANDTFTIVFDEPQSLDKVVIVTGSKDYPDDKLNNGVLRASPTKLSSLGAKECAGYVELGRVDNGKITVSDFHSKMGIFKTSCLQLFVTKSQTFWLIIKEIAVFVTKNN